MVDLLDNPRVRELLRQAEEALVLLAADDDRTVRDALDAVYQDLGRTVFGLARQKKHLEPLEPLQVEDLPEGPGAFGDRDDLTAIPGPDELMHTRVPAALAMGDRIVLDQLVVQMRGHGPLGHDLVELLALLTPPLDLLDPEAMPEEASKVQWASGELSGRLADHAHTVQAAVLGMLAARARNVAAHLDVDVGPRMAIDRLRRYREQEELPWVAGLLPNARPERDTWAEDALGYWELLRRG